MPLVYENSIAKKKIEVVKGKQIVTYLDPNNVKVPTGPYKDAKGNIIDQNNNPVIFDPLEKPVVDGIRSAQANKDPDYDNTVFNCVGVILMTRIQPYVNLTFVRRPPTSTPINGEIRISFEPTSGCWSKIGTDALTVPKDQATMNFAWFSVADVLHQFGHALGLVHEHQRPDRDGQLSFNLPLLYSWAKTVTGRDEKSVNSNIVDKFNQEQINGANFYNNNFNKIFKPETLAAIGSIFDYDPDSIMLDFFPSDIMVNPVTGKPPGKGTKQNRRLSKKDVVILNFMYPGNGTNKITKPHRKKLPSGGYVNGTQIVHQFRQSADDFYFDTYGEHLSPWNKIKFVFKTSDEWFSGTDATILIGMTTINKDQIFVPFKNDDDDENQLETGSTDVFTFESPLIDRETLNKDIILKFKPYIPDLIGFAGDPEQFAQAWKIEKISIYYNGEFIKSYTPDIWLGDEEGTEKSITLSNDNYDISLKENFQLGFDTSDSVGFGVTIGLIILAVIILIVILYFFIKNKKKRV
jgi:hypothetical protein